jgi:hypothetical protein
MKLEIEIPDPPEGCDPAAVQWGVPPKCAWKLVAHMGKWIWRHHEFQTHGETAWVMPYTPGFLWLLEPGWVTHDEVWRWFRDQPHWSGNQWYTTTHTYRLPFREVPPISGEYAIWEVPHD